MNKVLLHNLEDTSMERHTARYTTIKSKWFAARCSWVQVSVVDPDF